jgi:hypothetical protein
VTDVQAASAPVIRNVNVVTPNVARYEKFEARFDVTTGATNPSLPFDPNPPPGLPPRVGISVEAQFSRDNWSTFITQPAFWDQPYTHTVRDGKDHFTPSGPPRWTVRFAPQQTGVWQYRLRAQDAGGTTFYPASGALTFTVSGESANPYTRHGFLRVSSTDRRYFEFQDGAPFIGVGFNDGFSNAANVEQRLQQYEQNKMNFMRVWVSGAGINGSQWTSWASHHLSPDGYLPGVSFDFQNTFNGADVAMKLNSSNPCFFTDFWQGGVPVEPSTPYRLTARVKLSNVTGPAGAGTYGFVVKQSGWLGTDCDKANQGTPITPPVVGSTGWITVTGTYTTTASQYWLDNLYLTRQNATGGAVYVDEVRVWRANDPAQVNLLREPNANSHLYFDPMNSAQWDLFVQSAEQHGVYLKLVTDEKNEWIKNHLTASGAMTTAASNNNFYAAPNTKVRWLEQAWWRYLIARWGYSPAIHSFEYVNEGDPYNSYHYEAANAMARYFHQTDPSHHLVTTSYWAAFPNIEFWSNPNYLDVDYADLHAYISTGWGLTASFLDPSRVETRPQYVHSGQASAHLAGADNSGQAITPRGLVIHGPGEWIVRYWMKANNFTANCPFNSTGGMERVRWQIDGGKYGKPPNTGPWEGVIPFNNEGKDFICTSPAGTFDWRQFRSDRDRNGNLLSAQYRLVLSDSQPHEISLRIENSNGAGGDAWIDDVELVSPSGQVTPVIGQFDITPLDEDTAWYNRAYGELFGASSPVGARVPLVRGETGVDTPTAQDWNRALTQDTAGIWLHNNVWGQINAGGMYDLMWWAAETIPPSLYPNYLTYRNFMDGVPLSNGFYRDIGAQTSNLNLRAWGQRDDVHGRMHLWVQNIQHTWKRVVSGPPVTPVSGSITISAVPGGVYRVEWWNAYQAQNPVFLTQTVSASGTLVLPLPTSLSTDVAIKIERVRNDEALAQIFLPLMQK